MSKPEIVPMSITGEFVTNYARSVCMSRGFDEASDFLQDMVPALTLAQCEKIVRKKARLTGESPTVNYEEVE